MNLGNDDFLSTGVCNCVENAVASIDATTGVTACGCIDGLTMTMPNGLDEARVCAASKCPNENNSIKQTRCLFSYLRRGH